MDFTNDKRVVMTLDAGGTNFVFSAICGGKEVVEPVTFPSNGDNLEKCLDTIVSGFSFIKTKLTSEPVAISFAFPGPADYPNGIIGDLFNLPCFKGGVALGPMLEGVFGVPVFINNDGNLFAYGEACFGFLPYINEAFEKAGSEKRFKNLVGVTLGTGFGAGIVNDGVLQIGDNSGAGEVWLLRNRIHPEINAEESISIRAVKRVYCELVGLAIENSPEPKDIADIAYGKIEGNQAAAKESFRQLGVVLGDALGNILTVTDGIAVIGGGIANAGDLIMKPMIEELSSHFEDFSGDPSYSRTAQRPYNLEDELELAEFSADRSIEIKVPRSDKVVKYDALQRLGVGVSKLGTSKAVALGAYCFALNKLDTK
ncbi:MAG: ROK family protein [Lentisphaeria bacterium]|nr:ROK family protein [Lentisphaeria bacterium]